MQPESEKSKKTPRKHVTTACVPCRESKIRVCCAQIHGSGFGYVSNDLDSAMGLLRIATIVSAKGKSASINMEMTSASTYFESRLRLAASEIIYKKEEEVWWWFRIADPIYMILEFPFVLRRNFFQRGLTNCRSLFTTTG